MSTYTKVLANETYSPSLLLEEEGVVIVKNKESGQYCAQKAQGTVWMNPLEGRWALFFPHLAPLMKFDPAPYIDFYQNWKGKNIPAATPSYAVQDEE